MPVTHASLVNFYAHLELTDEADEADIKQAYRKLVLKWHPDKNPKDRAKAEEQIRVINAAYATLSNPTKREKYDLQRFAIDKTKKKAPKPRVSKKVSVPKEFMMQPLGHPDNFVRYKEKKTSVPARQDMEELRFKDFFESTKFSLWWVASDSDVNNMCRVRAMGSKAKGDRRGVTKGLAGGLNLSFKVKDDTESEVILAAAEKGKRKDIVDFVVKDSPEFDGAVRFETACKRGHYLAFFPPCDLRVVPFLNEMEGRVLDFMLTDFSATLRFKDLEEVLVPLAEKKKHGLWVPLSELRESQEVAAYFQKVMKKPLWDVEDFAAYFEGHWTQWEYRADDQMVRLRPLDEKLSKVLRSASTSADVARAVAMSGEELSKVNLSGALRAIHLLGKADAEYKEGIGKPDASKNERSKLLHAIPTALYDLLEQEKKDAATPDAPAESAAAKQEADVDGFIERVCGQADAPAGEQAIQPLGERTIETTEPTETEVRRLMKEREEVSVQDLLAAAEGMFGLAGELPTTGVLRQRKAAVRALLELIAARLERSKAASSDSSDEGFSLKPEEIMRLLRLPGIRDHDQVLTKVCATALSVASRSMLVKVVQRGTIVECHGVVEAALVACLQALNYVDADEGAAMIASLARAGARVDRLAVALRGRAQFVSVPALASTILALCEKNASSDALQPVAERLGKAQLKDLEIETLVALAVAATSKPSLGLVLDAVAKAASSAASKWPVEAMVRLLLALVKTKEHMQSEVREALLRDAISAIGPKLKQMEAAEILKVALAASGHGSAAFMEVVAKEVAIIMMDVALPQLLLFTQALSQGLVPGHSVLQQVLSLWADKLKVGGKWFHEIENLVKLAQAATPTLRLGVAGESGEARQRFATALCNKLEGHVAELSQANRDILGPQFETEGAFGSVKRREHLLEKLAQRVKIQKPKKINRAQLGERERSRSRSPGPLSKAEATAMLAAAGANFKASARAKDPTQQPSQKTSKKRPLEKPGEEINASGSSKRKRTKKRRAVTRRLGLDNSTR